MTCPLSRSTTANTLGEANTVWMIRRLSSTLSWGFHPRWGPPGGPWHTGTGPPRPLPERAGGSSAPFPILTSAILSPLSQTVPAPRPAPTFPQDHTSRNLPWRGGDQRASLLVRGKYPMRGGRHYRGSLGSRGDQIHHKGVHRGQVCPLCALLPTFPARGKAGRGTGAEPPQRNIPTPPRAPSARSSPPRRS